MSAFPGQIYPCYRMRREVSRPASNDAITINFNNDDKYELEPSSDSRPEPLTCISLGYQSEVEAIAQNARLNFVLTNGGRTARWHDRTGKTATARSPVTGLRMNFMLSLEHLSTVSSLAKQRAGGQMEHFQPHARVSCGCQNILHYCTISTVCSVTGNDNRLFSRRCLPIV